MSRQIDFDIELNQLGTGTTVVDFEIETMAPTDWREVAALIHDSTNGWYETNRGMSIFQGGPESTLLFCDVYETLDPGCCFIARSGGKIIGSCFYHPRETHYSLGIMNVHPDAFGRGVARKLLQQVIDEATDDGLPVRLVSSAMNLDSYSLYTKAGFVPRQTYQDMIIEIPALGINADDSELVKVREAIDSDVATMGELEYQVSGIRRNKDYQHFISNDKSHWHCAVLEEAGKLKGWIVSIAHAASNMIGPCIAADQETAITLLRSELNHRAGETMVFLLPVDCDQIVKTAYGWGAKNCELHVAQIYGQFQPVRGVSMPTFMPETG